MNNQETVKYLRAEAKKLGLTFRLDKEVTLNGSPCYMFVCRKTGKLVLSLQRLSVAHENMRSGYVATQAHRILD